MDLLSQLLSLLDGLGVRVEVSSIGQSLDLILDLLVVLVVVNGVLTDGLALQTLLVQTELLLFSSLLLHFVHQQVVIVNVFKVLSTFIDMFLLFEIVHEGLLVLNLIGNTRIGILFDLGKLLVLLHLSLGLGLSSSSLNLGQQLLTLLILLLLQVHLDLVLSLLVLAKDLLEVGIIPSILELLLERNKPLILLVFELFIQSIQLGFLILLELLQLNVSFLLDLLKDDLLLLFLLDFIVSDLLVHLFELVLDGLSAVASGIQSSLEQLMLSVLVSTHHVLNLLHFVLKLVHDSIDLIT